MKILIIGGGFSGLSAAYRLSKSGKNLEIILFDKKPVSDFLPTLPDCLGRGINPEYLSYKIEDAVRRYGFKFINKEVTSLNLDKKEILSAGKIFNYDYLIVASGSETNFYGNENIRQNAYKLDEVEDARKIIEGLKTSEFENFIIGGGGYTGIEVATNLRIFLERAGRKSRITVIERAPSILGPLPQWMKDYVGANLKKLRIDVLVNSAIEKIEAGRVNIQGGGVFERAMVVWAAGVKTPAFIQALAVEKNPQGRIRVDESLRLNANCFVVGDAAYFAYENAFLRMAVQFAITQGDCAARNVIRSIKNKPLIKYKPVDFGYIIPMANNSSCGQICGVNLKGFMPTAFHFLMCIYRSYGLKNKSGIIAGILKGGA